MIETNITTPGKVYTNIENLQVWDKNPRAIDKKDMERLKHQIKELGMYKPLLVTGDGIVVGGNMRFRVLQELGVKQVWVTILAFQDVSGAQATDDGSIPVQVVIDGDVQPRIFKSQEQAMIEYALSDNDQAGSYDQQALAELLIPVQEDILPDYRLELAPSVSLNTFVDQYQPPEGGDPKLPEQKSKSKEINIVIKYTPEQFAEVEPKLEKIKAHAGLENITDLFGLLVETYLGATNANTDNLALETEVNPAGATSENTTTNQPSV